MSFLFVCLFFFFIFFFGGRVCEDGALHICNCMQNKSLPKLDPFFFVLLICRKYITVNVGGIHWARFVLL